MADPFAASELQRTAHLLTSHWDRDRAEGRAQLGALLDAIDVLNPEERRACAIGVLEDLCRQVADQTILRNDRGGCTEGSG